jgi:Zinc carboxypeptidase
MTRRILSSAVLLFITLAAFAEQPDLSPSTLLRYPLGSRFTTYERLLDVYSSMGIRFEPIGTTYENRELLLAVFTNRQDVDQIRQTLATIARGEGNIDELVKNTPAVVWLAFGIHGNESSSAEAALEVAYWLKHQPEGQQLLNDVIVVLDPLENPDGRERYVQWFNRSVGSRPNTNPDSFEHLEPWPGGRYNHYMIDMNRDWAWMSQRETQARVAAYQKWHPQVFVDFHEMSHNSTYFFPPDARPINANVPKDAEKWLETFGKANAAAFSAKGWPFFVAERFDLFYPGYGDSWPSLHGAIGMTYEVGGGGRGGVAVERTDRTVLTLRDRIDRHVATAKETVRTAARHREQLLRYTHAAARANIEGGKNTFLLVPGSPNFDHLVSLLQKQGIRVEMLTNAATIRATRIDGTSAESRSFPAGTAIVSTRQPLGGLANTLLEKAPAFGKGFVEEQREKAEADEPDDFYDLTTWSLPLAMNVEGYVTTVPVEGTTEYAKSGAPPFRTAAFGYLVDAMDPEIYRFAGRLLESGIRFSIADSDLEAGERTFHRGSLVILKSNNAATLDAELGRIANESGVATAGIESGWMGGTAFGSEKIRPVVDPKIALVGGQGSFATSFGMLWHTLDIDTPIPHSVLSVDSLRTIDLNKYEVLIFPDGNYAERLGKRGVDRIKSWVSEGGTLVAVKGANAFLREKDVEVSKLKLWEPPKKDDKPAGNERYNDFRVPGSAFRTTMNARSYLTFGVPRSPAVLVEGTDAFLPVAKKVDNILTIDAKEPLISGVAWPESIERLKGSVYVVAEPFGRGQVITFADDPHFRLFWRGTLPVFLNAVLYSPTFPR